MGEYAHVRVRGNPLERGRQYGGQARQQIRRSIEGYRQVFEGFAQWNWDKVRDEALAFEAPIAQYDPRYLDEMRGIGEGAGVPLADVLAINVRTEIMYGAKGREALATDHADAAECTSLALMPSATRDRRTLLAQNWDWLPFCFDTVVVLEVQQEEGPDFVTIVEAGILAKTGMNSSGIGVGTNALVSSTDLGASGVPFHVIVRALLDSETMADALASIQRPLRSSSANYMLAHEDGTVLSVETMPGTFASVYPIMPEKGAVAHTNHFISPRSQGDDLSLWVMPDSPLRLEKVQEYLDANSGDISVEGLKELFRDHSDYPMGICFHPDARQEMHNQGATIFSAILDLRARRIHLADGYPCRSPYRELDYSEFLSKPSPVRESRPDRVP